MSESQNENYVIFVLTDSSGWDDEYGISVHNKDHTTKESISKLSQGLKLLLTHLE